MPANLLSDAVNIPPGPGVFNAPREGFTSGTAPYTVLADSPQFSWDAGERSATETYLMSAYDVYAFVQRAIGLDVPYYDAPFMMRRKRKMPGNSDLIASKISARPFEDERPADPCVTDPLYQTDLRSYNQKYSRSMMVTIEYSSKDSIERGMEDFTDKNNPESYTEQKSTAGGEFLLIGQSQTFFIPIINVASRGSTGGGGFSYISKDPADPNWQLNPTKIQYERVDSDDRYFAEANAAIEVAHAKVIPTREITITWRHVFHVPYRTIKEALGRVNAAVKSVTLALAVPPVVVINDLKPMALFNYAAPETILFTGATITQENLVAPDGRPLFTVEYKFIEKTIFVYKTADTIVYDATQNPPDGATAVAILGWNHFWRQTHGPKKVAGADPAGTPTTGGAWERLILNKDTGETPYNSYDFLKLFAPEPHGFVRMVSGGAEMVGRRRIRSNIERGNANVTPMP